MRFPRFIHALIPAAVLAGCSSGPAIDPSTPYQGPGLRVDSEPKVHHLVFTAPTPGWGVVIDRTTETPGAQRVFATIRRPNPQFIYPQVLVEQRVATSVPRDQPVEVFVRVLEFDARASGAYSPVPPIGMPGEGGQTP